MEINYTGSGGSCTAARCSGYGFLTQCNCVKNEERVISVNYRITKGSPQPCFRVLLQLLWFTEIGKIEVRRKK